MAQSFIWSSDYFINGTQEPDHNVHEFVREEETHSIEQNLLDLGVDPELEATQPMIKVGSDMVPYLRGSTFMDGEYCVGLNGVDAYIYLNSNARNFVDHTWATDFTIELCLRGVEMSGTNYILNFPRNNSGALAFLIRSVENSLEGRIRDDGVNTSTTIIHRMTPGLFYDIEINWIAADDKLVYSVNGVWVAEYVVSVPETISANALVMGCRYREDTGTQTDFGKAEVRSIKIIDNTTVTGNWEMDEATGNTVNDSSVNDYHGTIFPTDPADPDWVHLKQFDVNSFLRKT